MTGPPPTAEQLAATRPDRSNWVGANAGSGKTHVLTQRVARLLLAGAEPQKILCLTYTKAAASEMQTRLFRTLGDWAMADQDALVAIMAGLTGQGADAAPESDLLARARRLFARALETPGGLKIQTIHAFCETLLRRFPLEAGVSPRFEVADDLQTAALMMRARREMAAAAEAGSDDGFDRAARALNEGGIDDLARSVLARRGDIGGITVEDTLEAVFGSAAHATPVEIAKAALAELDWESYAAIRDVLAQHGGKSERPVAEVLPLDPELRARDPSGSVERLIGRVLTQKAEARKSGFPTVGVKRALPSAEVDLERLTDWALRTRATLMAAGAAGRARDLHCFGQPLIERYAAGKAAHGMLDFDDLITRTRDLLTGRDQRAWVLFKLDQGVDHILVDEAQDTSPAQWDVVSAIADEFLSGAGAREAERTLFVVGDEKQSIYSFQGAEPAAFGRMRSHFDEALGHLGKPLGRPDLVTSFRSAPAILDFVDKVFEGAASHGLTVDGTPVIHQAHRAGDHGRVDLWPLVERVATPEPPEWWQPVDMPPATDTKARLADLVAGHIASLIGTAYLPVRAGKPARLVRPDDVLVLVTRRDRLAQGIIRGLKVRGVPVAGADRLALATEIAVKDLMALARFAVMPSDDLSLAELLRSPLCGISEEALFALAHDRQVSLWQAVREAPEHGDMAGYLADMIRQADYLRPYEFLERALTHHDGRRRLMARLGAEAEDPIDELLAQALAFERRHPPSLAGLIHWIETGEQIVKREMDQSAGQVRVMTVHGAKGLEAPIVILPDTISAGSPGGGRPLLLEVGNAGNAPPLTLWAGPKASDDPVTAEARAAHLARDEHEHRRLLYVALTRAEDWLILCGAQQRSMPEDAWYTLLGDGMARCAQAHEEPSPTGEGVMLRFETNAGSAAAPETAVDTTATTGTGDAAAEPGPVMPAWLSPARRETRVERIAPSDLVAHEFEGGTGAGRDLAMRRGVAIHTILEHATPGQPGWEASARALLARDFADLPQEAVPGMLGEVAAVLAMPEAAWIFGPESAAEVAVAIEPPRSGPRMIGRIDRLIRRDGGLIVLDIKTDAVPPAGAHSTPLAYLVQIGAYVSAMQGECPPAKLEAALLWTAPPRLDRISAEVALAAFHRTRR